MTGQTGAESSSPSPPRLDNPIFVVGAGRSGTTLLRSVLSAHSRIAIAPETHYLAYAEDRGLENGAPADFNEFWERYIRWSRFKDVNVSPVRCLELMPDTTIPTFKEVFQAVLGAYGESVGKARVGEKTPGHSRFLSVLYEWFPDAQVVFMIRDPRAVVASQLKTAYVKARLTPFGLRSGFISGSRLHEVAHFATNWSVVAGHRLAAWIGDSRLHVLKYERLVEDPDSAIRLVCSFLGEVYEPSMLGPRASALEPASPLQDREMEAWRKEHHRKSRRRISRGSLDRWREELSPLEIRIIEGVCASDMAVHGYQPAAKRRVGFNGATLARLLLGAGSMENRLRGRDMTPYIRARATEPKFVPPGGSGNAE